MRGRVRGGLGSSGRGGGSRPHWPGAVLALPEAPEQADAGQQYHKRVDDTVLAEDDFVDFHRNSSKE